MMHALHSCNQIKKNAMCGTCGRRSACSDIVRKREEEESAGRPRRRWKDNIKTDLQEIGRGHGMD